MNRSPLLPMLLLAVLTGCARPAQAEPEPAPTDPPAPTEAPEPTPQPAPVAPEIDALLDRIEAAAKDIKTLTTPLRYDRIQGLLGDEQRRFGELAYDAGPPAKFDAGFDRLWIKDEPSRKIDLRFTYDGVWLAERDGDDRSFTRRQLAEEGTPGSGMGAFSGGGGGVISGGPFVLPLDARKADILARFEVYPIDPIEEDPKGTIHLKLVPREHVRIDQVQIDLWYDRDTLLPRQVRTVDRAENTSVIVLMKVETNKKLKDARFDTSAPRGGGWDVQIVPLEQSE